MINYILNCFKVFLSILDGLVFLRLSDNPQESTAFYNRFGCLFLVATDVIRYFFFNSYKIIYF